MSAGSLDIPDLQSRLDGEGYIYLNDLAPDFDYLSQLSRLGSVLPQHHGQSVRDIKVDPAIPDDVITPYSRAELVPHTEWHEFPGTPPRYVALWCVTPAEGGGGETTLADGYKYLEQLPADERELLSSTALRWRSQKTLEREGIRQATDAPALTVCRGRTVMRFSTMYVDRASAVAERYVAGGADFFEYNKVPIGIARGALLIWDNWRMLHSRNRFLDPRRHLRRVLLQDASVS